MNRYINLFLISVLSAVWFSAIAQNSLPNQCKLSISGKLLDADAKEPLPFATIQIEHSETGANSDDNGKFILENLCPGKYVLKITYIGYDSLVVPLTLTQSLTKDFELKKSVGTLSEVVISGQKENTTYTSTQQVDVLKKLDLEKTTGLTLGESLKEITGVNSIQTGPSISKPVIHGLYSNRVLILNNDIRQEGQQWGSEHAPEIDPFIASKISVIKGAASIRYGSDAIGGVILLEPEPMPSTVGLSGELSLVGATNGRMGVVSGMLQQALGKKLTGLSWRLQGTLKKAGNFRTAHYYMNNTGVEEGDFSAAAAYNKKNYGLEMYFSQFNTKIGIFDGSHVGNVDDLYAAFERPEPITPDVFTYEIGRSYQTVQHDLFKAKGYIDLNNAGKFEATYGWQQNVRKEYDIDVPYSTDPNVFNEAQLEFHLITNTIDFNWQHKPTKTLAGTIGVNGETQGNVFYGVRTLIPNFRNYTGGIYAIEKWTKDKLTLEGGLRYDYRWLRVYRLQDNSLDLITPTYTYQNVTGTIGAQYRFNDRLSVNANYGNAWRAPSINELYIQGIHLSAATYELGDTTLKVEHSNDFTFSGEYRSNWLLLQLGLYHNIINNFIFSEPTLQTVTLASGTYPLFIYTAADVVFNGMDADVEVRFLKNFTFISKTAIVRAWNKTINDYLIYTPADRFENSVKYELPKLWKLNAFYASVGNLTVLKQTRVPPNSDYVPPPPGYSLFNAQVGCSIPVMKRMVDISLTASNFTNVAYRDYLNHFRYYTDDVGANFLLRVNIPFNK